MKVDQEQVRNLLADTVSMLCRNGLAYQDELKIEGLIGITLDNNEVFLVHLNEKFENKAIGRINDEVEAEESEDESVMFIKTERVESSPVGSNKQHSNHQKVNTKHKPRSGHVAGVKRPSISDPDAPSPVRIKQEIKEEPQGDPDERVPPLHGQGDLLSIHGGVHSGLSSMKILQGGKKGSNSSFSSPILPNLQEQFAEASMTPPSTQGTISWPGGMDGNMKAEEDGRTSQGWALDDAAISQMNFDSSSFSEGNSMGQFCVDFSPYLVRRRRTDETKQFGCTYEGCDKRFYLRKHLYRHQRLKHGAEYKVPPKPRYDGPQQADQEILTLEAIQNIMTSSMTAADRGSISYSRYSNETDKCITLEIDGDKSLDNLQESGDSTLETVPQDDFHNNQDVVDLAAYNDVGCVAESSDEAVSEGIVSAVLPGANTAV